MNYNRVSRNKCHSQDPLRLNEPRKSTPSLPPIDKRAFATN